MWLTEFPLSMYRLVLRIYPSLWRYIYLSTLPYRKHWKRTRTTDLSWSGGSARSGPCTSCAGSLTGGHVGGNTAHCTFLHRATFDTLYRNLPRIRKPTPLFSITLLSQSVFTLQSIYLIWKWITLIISIIITVVTAVITSVLLLFYMLLTHPLVTGRVPVYISDYDVVFT